jgi:DNA-binding NarL/FixJ family response regulator
MGRTRPGRPAHTTTSRLGWVTRTLRWEVSTLSSVGADAPVDDESADGLLAIHVNPANEDELRSLLDTVTSLMWRRDRDRRVQEGIVSAASWPPQLSGREVEITQFYAEGENAESIAAQLQISAHTVRSHTKSIRQKLRSASMTQAVAVGIMLGVVIPKTPDIVAGEERARALFLDP